MTCISGADLSKEKHVKVGLTYIYGIGKASSDHILTAADVNPDARVKDLTGDEIEKLASIVAEVQATEGDLHRGAAMNIKRPRETGCYRGIRHRRSLPIHGQKIKTNIRTCEGPRKAVTNKKK